MPVYEYRCQQCQKIHEVMQRISEAPLATCPDCGGVLTKLISNTSFVLKGGGWYADGYAASSAAGSDDSGSSAQSDGAKPSPESSSPSDTAKPSPAASSEAASSGGSDKKPPSGGESGKAAAA